MKVLLPENSSDITLLQYQKYYDLLQREGLDEYQTNVRKIQIFTGLKPIEIESLEQKDINEMLAQIEVALNSPVAFVDRFFIDDVEFGFVVLDKITGAEYFDLSKYGDNVETLQNLMAILFRPIKDKDSNGNYSIQPYNGSAEWAELMKLTPMNVVNGALFFFVNLSNELVSYTLRYTEAEQAREKSQASTLKSGVGMQRLMNWLRVRFGNTKKSLT